MVTHYTIDNGVKKNKTKMANKSIKSIIKPICITKVTLSLSFTLMNTRQMDIKKENEAETI